MGVGPAVVVGVGVGVGAAARPLDTSRRTAEPTCADAPGAGVEPMTVPAGRSETVATSSGRTPPRAPRHRRRRSSSRRSGGRCSSRMPRPGAPSNRAAPWCRRRDRPRGRFRRRAGSSARRRVRREDPRPRWRRACPGASPGRGRPRRPPSESRSGSVRPTDPRSPRGGRRGRSGSRLGATGGGHERHGDGDEREDGHDDDRGHPAGTRVPEPSGDRGRGRSGVLHDRRGDPRRGTQDPRRRNRRRGGGRGPQCRAHLGGVGEPIGRVFQQRPHEHAIQRGRHPSRPHRSHRGRGVQLRPDHGIPVSALERRPAGEREVQQPADLIQVAGDPHRLAPQLLRRGVLRVADHAGRGRGGAAEHVVTPRRPARGIRETEVEERRASRRRPLEADEDVRRRHVAVDEPARVRDLEGAEDHVAETARRRGAEGPWARTCSARVVPSSSSWAIQAIVTSPSWNVPMSTTSTMPGCATAAVRRASSRNAARTASLSDRCGWSILMATGRSRTVSVAANTDAVPPEPSSPSRRNRPAMSPDAAVTGVHADPGAASRRGPDAHTLRDGRGGQRRGGGAPGGGGLARRLVPARGGEDRTIAPADDPAVRGRLRAADGGDGHLVDAGLLGDDRVEGRPGRDEDAGAARELAVVGREQPPHTEHPERGEGCFRGGLAEAAGGDRPLREQVRAEQQPRGQAGVVDRAERVEHDPCAPRCAIGERLAHGHPCLTAAELVGRAPVLQSVGKKMAAPGFRRSIGG